MIELLIYGIAIIVGASVGAIVMVIGIYYLFTKTRTQKKEEKKTFTLDKQKEI